MLAALRLLADGDANAADGEVEAVGAGGDAEVEEAVAALDLESVTVDALDHFVSLFVPTQLSYREEARRATISASLFKIF